LRSGGVVSQCGSGGAWMVRLVIASLSLRRTPYWRAG
jgi:hypothetical protein